MAKADTELISMILTMAERIRQSAKNQELSVEQVLLAILRIHTDPDGCGIVRDSIDPAEWNDLDLVLREGMTDPVDARNVVETYVMSHPASDRDGQKWQGLVQTVRAAAGRMEMETVTAGLLLRGIFATEPECVRAFLVSVARENERKADLMFVDSPEDLEGAADFRAFVREVTQMVPVLRKFGAERTLTEQVILLSVDRDGGIETYLQMLQDLYADLELCEFEAEPTVLSLPFQFMPDGSSFLDHMNLEKVNSGILCFDIAEWVESVEHEAFEDFLLKLKNTGDKFIYVFRMPYAEDTICKRVAAMLQDLFPVRLIRIAPWSPAYAHRIAMRCLKRQGFDADEDAMLTFEQRLREEKQDGKFYGYQTIRKITDEMIYRKLMQLADGPGEPADGAVNDRTIHGADVCGLSQASFCLDEQELLHKELYGRAEQVRELNARIRSLSGKRESRRGILFQGNPGTGKIAAARYMASKMKSRGILTDADLRICKLSELEGQYEGTTTANVLRTLRDCAGGVLYINVQDEPEEDLSGLDEEQQSILRARFEAFRAAVMHTLFSQLASARYAGIVILAGPAKEIDRLCERYPEMESLFFERIIFTEYTAAELAELFLNLLDVGGISKGKGLARSVREYFARSGADILEKEEFTNARYINNLVRHAWSKAQIRSEIEQISQVEVLPCDFLLAAADSWEELNRKEHEDRTIGFIQRRNE